MTARGSGWVSGALGLGLVLVFAGERLIGSGVWRTALSGAGVALVAGAFALRLVRAARLDAQRASVERLLAAFAGIGIAGLAIYFLQSDLVTGAGLRLKDDAPKLATLLAGVYPLLVAIAVLPTALAEMAYSAVAAAPRVEVRRIRDAALSGLGVVAALTFAFAAAYVADVKDPTWDFSFFRTAKPGDATRKLIRGLDQPLEISLFFPPGNDVSVELEEYLKGLQPESTRLKIGSYDAAVDLGRARELSVTSNGAVVLKTGQRKETLLFPLELDRARSDLRKLDQTLQDKLFQLTRPRRTVYVTVGHGERGADKVGGSSEQRGKLVAFRKLLEALNQDVKPLSAADGLATEIPTDAAAVLVVGPTAAFLPEEQSALIRYFQNGGRLLVALDPETEADLTPLLTALGVTFQKTTLANDRFYVQRTHTPSDKAFIATFGYSSHPVVTSVSQGQGQNRPPMIFSRAGYLEEAKGKPAQLILDFPVRAHPSTYDDKNGSFTFDHPAEAQKAWGLVAAASRRTIAQKPGEKATDSRALVVADSDIFADGVLDAWLADAYFALDAMKWLIGEEAVAGTVNKETDIRIEHSRGQDTAYFYLTVLGVPALVLAGGVLGTRRRTRRAR